MTISTPGPPARGGAVCSDRRKWAGVILRSIASKFADTLTAAGTARAIIISPARAQVAPFHSIAIGGARRQDPPPRNSPAAVVRALFESTLFHSRQSEQSESACRWTIFTLTRRSSGRAVLEMRHQTRAARFRSSRQIVEPDVAMVLQRRSGTQRRFSARLDDIADEEARAVLNCHASMRSRLPTNQMVLSPDSETSASNHIWQIYRRSRADSSRRRRRPLDRAIPGSNSRATLVAIGVDPFIETEIALLGESRRHSIAPPRSLESPAMPRGAARIAPRLAANRQARSRASSRSPGPPRQHFRVKRVVFVIDDTYKLEPLARFGPPLAAAHEVCARTRRTVGDRDGRYARAGRSVGRRRIREAIRDRDAHAIPPHSSSSAPR